MSLIVLEVIRDFFEPGGSDRVCSIVRELLSYPDHDEAISQDHHILLSAILSLSRTVSKSESNKSTCYIASPNCNVTYIYMIWSSIISAFYILDCCVP